VTRAKGPKEDRIRLPVAEDEAADVGLVRLTRDQQLAVVTAAQAGVRAEHAIGGVEDDPKVAFVVANGRLFPLEPTLWPRLYRIKEVVRKPRTGNPRGPEGTTDLTVAKLLGARFEYGKRLDAKLLAAYTGVSDRTIRKWFPDGTDSLRDDGMIPPRLLQAIERTTALSKRPSRPNKETPGQ
jgi:hypothetical protein